jgi:uncharacterized caspase-like protein
VIRVEPVFLSGHGETDPDKGTYAFLPADFHFSDLSSLDKAGISQAVLGAALQEVKARKLLVLIDTCKSGQAAKALGQLVAMRGMAEQRALAVLARASGIAIAAASTDRQTALEDAGLGHGVFTYVLLQAMRAGGGPVTVSRVLGEVEQKVPQISEEKYRHQQDPIISRAGQDFPLVQGD